jgi:NADH-quinone oxidoreductase subunit N
MNIIIWLLIIDLRIEKNGKIYEIETLNDLNSIFLINPILSLVFLILFLSMIGLPPFLGFISKILILFTIFKSKYYLIFFLTLFFSSLASFYYLRIIKIIFFEKAQKINNIFLQSKIISYIIIINTLFLLYFFLFPHKIYILLKIICFSFFI